VTWLNDQCKRYILLLQYEKFNDGCFVRPFQVSHCKEVK